MSLHDEAQRGTLAGEVLANPVYTEAYGLIEQEIIAKWQSATDLETRERLHLMLKMLGKVQQVLNGAMQSGKVSSKELEMQQSRLERLGSAFKRRSVA